MPKRKAIKYTCPSCGYDTEKKTMMYRHFFERKTTCPRTKADIELTNDIKSYVLANRIWNASSTSPPTTNTTINTINTINNFQCINNFVSNMNPMDKLQKYVDYNDLMTVNFGDYIEDTYKNEIRKLEKDKYRYGYKLERKHFMEIIDKLSGGETRDVDNINVIYDDSLMKLKIYNNDSWESHLIESGLQELITIIKANFLDTYETYLIKKIYDSNTTALEKTKNRESLFEYYKFISIFYVEPYVKGKTNEELLTNNIGDCESHDIDSNSIQDELMPKYHEILNSTMKSETSKIKKDIIEIVKRNSKNNIKELNKKIVTLFNMDENFKQIILKS